MRYTIPIFVTVLIVLGSCNQRKQQRPPKLVNGVLDIRDWDFISDGIVPLEGSWKYKWAVDSNEFIDPDYNTSKWDTIELPNSWKGTINESYGYGWHKATVHTNTNERLRLYLRSALGAYRLYLNGKEILSNGNPALNEEEYLMQRISKSVLLPQTDTLHFAWEMANFDDLVGGPAYPIIIGQDQEMLKFLFRKDFQNCILLGIILIMFVYHILFWIGRRKDLGNLFFGLFCFIILVRMITIELYLPYFITRQFIFITQFKLEYVSVPLGCLTFLLFISQIFPDESPKKIIRRLIELYILFSIFTLVTKPRIFTSLILVYQISALVPLVLTIFILYKALKNRRTYARLVLLGILVMGAGVIYDITITYISNDSRYLVSVALVIFTVIQSTVLSLRSAYAFKMVEHLSENLKEEVDLKTSDLQQKSEELKNINIELTKADEYKTRFFQNITHEFKTPLTLITGPVQAILSDQYGKISSAIKKQLIMVKENGIKTLHLVNQLIDLAKSDSEKRDLVLTIHNIEIIVKSVSAHFEHIAKQNNISLITEINTTSPLNSYIDITKFERIIFNLISNAFQHTNKEGEIVISLTSDQPNDANAKYLIKIKDTGTGISKEKLALFFDRFYKALSEDNYASQKPGIALAVVKEFTTQLGGYIEVESTKKTGTEFSLSFPLINTEDDIKKHYKPGEYKIAKTDSEQENRIKQEEVELYVNAANKPCIKQDIDETECIEISEDNKKTIVIIEDNVDMRSYIYDILCDQYKVYQACDGEEGFELIKKSIPDIVVSDIMMPKMDGIQLCSVMKSEPITEHIPIIMLTARSSSDDSIEGYSTGADAYITKPFNSELLLARISNLIESRIKLQDHYKTKMLLEPKNTAVKSDQEKFLVNAMSFVEDNITNSEYNVEHFTADMGISQAQLYRKLNQLIGQSPAEFIRLVRLKCAAKILEESYQLDVNVSEVAYKVGFNNHSHFSRLFKQHFKYSPKEYAKKYAMS